MCISGLRTKFTAYHYYLQSPHTKLGRGYCFHLTPNFLACHVADMSPTCRRHVSMSPNLGRHCVSLRHRRVPDTPNLYQLQPTITNQPKRTGTLGYHRVFVFELKQQSRNYRHNPPTCRQMSCRFGHPADTTLSCVCDMTSDVSRHVADTTQNVAVWAKKRHANIRHMELRIWADEFPTPLRRHGLAVKSL